MPFGEKQKKRPRGAAAASWAAAAQRKAGGSPDVKLRKLIEQFEGKEAQRPNESKVCTFCGATQGGWSYGGDRSRVLQFVLWRDTEEKAASAHYFPGQSRETDGKLLPLVKNRLSSELTKQHFATRELSLGCTQRLRP